MKVKHWDLHLTWEDGSVHEVSSYVSMGLVREVEDFIDYWEEKHGEDAHTDDCPAIDGFGCRCKESDDEEDKE